MADKVKEVAVEEADRLKTLTSDAARSGAYLYPIRVSLLPLGEDQRIYDYANDLRALHTSCRIGHYGSL